MTEAVYIPWADMEPALRAMIVYEQNEAFTVPEPQPILDRLRRETPVVRWEAGVGFFGMNDVLAASRNRSLSMTHPDTGRPLGLGSREPLVPMHFGGSEHRRYRRLLDPEFAPRTMAAREPEIRKLADELIDGFVGAGRAELFEAFCRPLPGKVFLDILGLPEDDLDFLTRMKDQILQNEGADLFQREEIGIEAGDLLRERLRARLVERRSERQQRNDILSNLMAAEADGERLTDEEIVSVLHLFAIAGLDTVTSSLSCIFARFASHSEERAKVVADPSLLPTAVEELLRFECPAPASAPLWAAEDTEVNGVPIAKGEMVFLCWASANLDPAAFEDPLTVRLDRPTARHLAFAVGPHYCLGVHLARVELIAAIDQFHRRIPDYRITPGDEPRFGLAGVRQARYLPISFTP